MNLPPHLQATLTLVTQGKGTDEIAAALRVTEASAAVYIRAVRRRLRRYERNRQQWEEDFSTVLDHLEFPVSHSDPRYNYAGECDAGNTIDDGGDCTD